MLPAQPPAAPAAPANPPAQPINQAPAAPAAPAAAPAQPPPVFQQYHAAPVQTFQPHNAGGAAGMMAAQDPNTARDPGSLPPAGAGQVPPTPAQAPGAPVPPAPGVPQPPQAQPAAPQPPGTPQPPRMDAQPPAPQLQVNPESFPGAPREAIQIAVDLAQEQGIPQDQTEAFVGEQLEIMRHHPTQESYMEHREVMGQLEQSLVRRFGEEGAMEALETITTNAERMGGQAYVDRMLADKELWHPEIIDRLLNMGREGGEGERGVSNPYDAWLERGGGGVAPGRGPVAAGSAPGVPGTAEDPAELQRAIAQHQSPQVKNSMTPDQWDQMNLQLHVRHQAATRAQGAGGFPMGG